MKKIKKSNELLWLFGMIFVSLGVATCSKANLGVSMIVAPSFVLQEALAPLSSFFSVGVTGYIVQGIILLLMCIIVRKFNWRYLLSFAIAVIYGYTLDLFIWLMSNIELTTIWSRWLTLLLGDVFTAFGVACFFRTYMPLQVYELFVAEVANRFKFKINITKWFFDISLLITSIILAITLFGDFKAFDWSTIGYSSFHNIGLGTIITTLINSALISIFGKILDRFFVATPLFPKLEHILKRK